MLIKASCHEDSKSMAYIDRESLVKWTAQWRGGAYNLTDDTAPSGGGRQSARSDIRHAPSNYLLVLRVEGSRYVLCTT